MTWPEFSVARLLTLALLAMGLVLVLPTAPAHACSCAMVTPDRALAGSDAVFLGEVIDKHTSVPTNGGTVFSAGTVVYTVDVSRVFKGDVTQSQRVVSSSDGASCGATLPSGKTMLIFAGEDSPGKSHSDGATLSTNLCAGNQVTTAAPASFGAGHVPGEVAAQPVKPTDSNPTQRPPAALIGLASVVVVGGLIMLWRRREQS